MENIAPKDPENPENLLFCVMRFSFQRICLVTEGMFTTSFEANHRDVISVLPISLLPKDVSVVHVQLAPVFVAFLPALFSTELGGLRYGFSFLPPTALLWQGPEAKTSNNGMYQLML